MRKFIQKVEGVVTAILKFVAQLVLISSGHIPIIISLKDHISVLAHYYYNL